MKLSIIIPCYNCEKTLEEAVASCYTQDLADDAFEIIMVDDGSSDSTRQVMESVAAKHPNITLLFHEKNKGGGAARNTGIRAARHEIIYCLDSDNYFAEHSVQQMLDYLTETDADGVAFYERRFFTNSNSQSFEYRYNKATDRCIFIEDLLAEPNIMLDNFFYTRKAYEKTNKYPEHHGFDTQTYEIDFLAREFKVRICPGSVFYHRQNQPGHKSYYEREYERGLISINTYLALEPIIDRLHSQAIELMVHFDVFQKNFHGKETHLRGELSTYVQSGGSLLHNTDKTQSALASTYATICSSFRNEKYSEAAKLLDIYEKQTSRELPLLQYMRMRIEQGLLGTSHSEIDGIVATELLKQGKLNRPKYRRIPHLLLPVYSAYKKLFK